MQLLTYLLTYLCFCAVTRAARIQCRSMLSWRKVEISSLVSQAVTREMKTRWILRPQTVAQEILR